MAKWDSYRDDLDTLKSELENLTETRNDVMRRIQIAEEEQQQPMKPTTEVQLWISSVEALETEVDELIKQACEEIDRLHPGGFYSRTFNMSSSYEFEDMVADKLQAVANLINEGAVLLADEVLVVTSLKDEGALEAAVPETIPEDEADDQWPIVGMESIINEVWRCLKKEGEEEEDEEGGGGGGGDDDDDDDDEEEDKDDDNDDVGIIGVYGMGGVGKTTLLKQINKKLDIEMKNDFDVVIWVVVSRDLQLDKIQQQIGGKIGLFDNKVGKHKNFEEKASDIFKILKEKKFVLLMDDLWERVDLTKVGVPLPSPENSSKIVFTTRSLQICSLMGADKLFKVTCLSDADAWKLFQALVGDETLQSHPEVWDLAEDVSRECYCLPLALVSIGRAVASKKTPQERSDVLVVLRRSMTSYSGSDDQLKESIYNKLKLSYDNLQNDMLKSCFLYCCLFPRNSEINKRGLIDYWIGEGFLDDRLGAQLSRGHYIIDVLLSVCLLEPSVEDDDSVKMHYWIHDMSLWIANKIEMEKGNCFFCTDAYSLTEAQVTENLVKATRMSLRNDVVIENLSDARKCPHLQTLFLIFDNNLEVISNDFFRFMPSLKVLNLSDNLLAKLPSGISNLILLQHLDLSCTRIQELPEELRALKKLKCLNLENTRNLCTIPRQLISEFSVLHVLRLWECGYCGILESTSDSVVCNDAQLLIEELLYLKNLSMLSITLDNSHALQRLLSSNRLQSCIQSLGLQFLSHPKSIKVPLTGLKHLNKLVISKCEYLEELEVDFRIVGEAQAHGVRESPCSFYFLHKVIISNCRRLRELTWLILAPNLKHLEISDCNEMEEIINVGKLSECPELMGNVIPFSKLKFLKLRDLPKLRSIYWSDLTFPDLKQQPTIRECPMLPLPHHRLNKMYVLPGPTVIESGGTGRNLEVPSKRDVSAESAKMAESAIENPDYQANQVIESGGTGKSLEVPSNRVVSVESVKMAESAIENPVYQSNQVIESGGNGKNLEVPSNRDVSAESAIENPVYQSNQVIESGGTGNSLEVPSNRDVSVVIDDYFTFNDWFEGPSVIFDSIENPVYGANQVIESRGTGKKLEVPSSRDVSAESAKMAESAIENPVYQANQVIESGGTGKSLEVPSNRDVSAESVKMAESAIENPVYQANQVIESGGTGKSLEVPSNRDVSAESAIENPVYQANQVIESGGTGKSLEVPSNRDVSAESAKMAESAIENPVYGANQVIESGGTGKNLELPSSRDISAESAKMAESVIENPVYQVNQVIESGGTGESLEVPSNRDVSAEAAKMAESAIENPVYGANQVIESGGTGKNLEFSSSRDISAESAIKIPVYQANQVIESGGTGKSLEAPSNRAVSAELAVSAAVILVEEVLSFLEREANLQKYVRDDVQRTRHWLSTIQASLKHMDGKEGDDIPKDRVSQVRDLAYDIEDVLDEFRVHVPTKFHRHRISKYVEGVFHPVKHRKALREMSSKVQRINRGMNDVITLDRLRSIPLEEGSSSGARVELCHVTPKEDDMVGFEGHKETLIKHLVGDSWSGLKHIWVVGIGGSGKTILVKNVYESKKVLKQYDCHAWIHVSRSCKINEVLRSTLKQLCKVRKQSDLLELNEGEVRDKLKKDLQRRRYLLVLDDVWGEDDWKSIVHALPQVSGGSKIIVTSPKHNLAKSCVGSSDYYILEIKGLEWKEAWNLFCKKAFPSSEGCCPRELEEWSQKIVKICEGLPLAIAAVGSLLSNKRQIPIEWKKLHDSLGSEIDYDSSLAIISRILLPGYKDLSINLKNCFLYFSIFPEDYSIARERLIRLWVAEGFIKERGGKTPEDVAEDYLNELIGRNLVEVSKFDFDGRVSFCRVQNLIKEFIILKSKEENFVKVVAESDSSSSNDYKIRRLSIHHSNTGWSDMSGLRCVRSLFIFEWDDSFRSVIRKVLHDLKLVRSLDLEGAPLAEFPKEIVELTLLRYLSLRRTKVATVPKSIKKLAYLETLDLKHTCVTKLPFEIYALKFLRYLLVYRYNFKNYEAFDSVQGVEVPAGVEGLSAIQKLSLINATKHKTIIAELKALVQLRKLGLIGLKKEDGRALCASIKEMEKLLTLDVRSSHKEEYIELDGMDDKPPSILQRLYLKGRLHKIPRWISSLDSLVRIGLKWSKLETSPLEVLQVLPNLMELRMVDAYTGDTLEFKAETFKQLKFLHLEQIEWLNTVIVEAKAMPKLEKLTICKCEKMEMLPLGISNLTQLRELLVYDMHKNFINGLQKNSDFRYMIEHIPVVHSFTLDSNQDWSLQNFS